MKGHDRVRIRVVLHPNDHGSASEKRVILYEIRRIVATSGSNDHEFRNLPVAGGKLRKLASNEPLNGRVPNRSLTQASS